MNSDFTLCSVGDISFYGPHSDTPSSDVFASVSPIFKTSDLSVINLENPLVDDENVHPVEGKCTLRGSAAWAGILKESGINLVSLANNHMMDYGKDGLFSTMTALETMGLPFVGAGKNRKDANQPLFMKLHENTIAFIARSSVVVASRCYAGDHEPGVAFLDVDETLNTIRECKKQADCVVLIIHWGIEQYLYPTPDQRILARELVQAGADIVLGHHPHVLQGMEKINGCPIFYSMGNFLFDEFNWSFINREGNPQQSRFKLSEKNRESGLFVIHSSGKKREYRFIPTVIANDGIIHLDESPKRLNEFKKLCSRLNVPLYNKVWKLYSLKMEWGLRIKPLMGGEITWARIKKIRPSHFKQLFLTLKRSLKITSEKSTNPYE